MVLYHEVSSSFFLLFCCFARVPCVSLHSLDSFLSQQLLYRECPCCLLSHVNSLSFNSFLGFSAFSLTHLPLIFLQIIADKSKHFALLATNGSNKKFTEFNSSQTHSCSQSLLHPSIPRYYQPLACQV